VKGSYLVFKYRILVAHPASVGRWLLVALAIWLLLFLAAFMFGSGSWSQAQAATIPQPSKAWVRRGKITGVREATSSVGVISRNQRVTCMEANAEKHFVNIFNQTLIWLRMTKDWCYVRRNHEVTTQPLARVTEGVTTLGSITQWTINGTEDRPSEYYPYEDWEKGGSRSWAVLKASRCFPTPFGCIQIGSATQTLEIQGHYDGSFGRY
jgi:hypothetical protein